MDPTELFKKLKKYDFDKTLTNDTFIQYCLDKLNNLQYSCIVNLESNDYIQKLIYLPNSEQLYWGILGTRLILCSIYEWVRILYDNFKYCEWKDKINMFIYIYYEGNVFKINQQVDLNQENLTNYFNTLVFC